MSSDELASTLQAEIDALYAVIRALLPLSDESRKRVVKRARRHLRMR